VRAVHAQEGENLLPRVRQRNEEAQAAAEDTALHSAGGENIHQQFFGLICGLSLVDNFLEPLIIKTALPKI
jgi:hypothetical protein